ncbi:MAG: nucleotidyltransferase domain-containing protein [Acidobacteriales bacterium]|nr:nucleotidyltransferase domain-containing protein [Terriglobales bacterium]
MVPDHLINEFIHRLREAAGDQLESVVLYGSAASGEFHADFSDVNLMCVLRETSYTVLTAIGPAVNWWTGKKHPAPLVFTREELVRSADVFSIELLDMKRRHRVLHGESPLTDLEVPMHHHRAQVEYELREKLILLRQRVLHAGGDKKKLWSLMIDSSPAFSTLIRHALLASGENNAKNNREAVEKFAQRAQFDPGALVQIMEVRRKNLDPKQLDVHEVLGRYLAAIEQVTSAVDRMLDA